MHKSNARLEQDLELTVKWKAPIVITSLGAREDVNQAVHGYGGVTLHDVINQTFARKAIEKGASGLICVAAGAGGHAGALSPFAFVQETREWFDGPLALSGAIATGGAVLAAQAMGADFAYIGSAFIATEEARAAPEYKRRSSRARPRTSSAPTCSPAYSAITCAPRSCSAGLDPDNLPKGDVKTMNFESAGGSKPKAWRDIWGSGQGIGAVKRVRPAAEFIEQLKQEYAAAKQRLRDTQAAAGRHSRRGRPVAAGDDGDVGGEGAHRAAVVVGAERACRAHSRGGAATQISRRRRRELAYASRADQPN